MHIKPILLLVAILLLALVKTGASPAQQLNIPAPDISGQQWINHAALNWQNLKGQVVLVEFWTFDCYNCKHVEPHIQSWYRQYRSKGFQVIAVHSPEFERERDYNNVLKYVRAAQIQYPVVIDNDFTIWRRFSNQYWPTMYLVDKIGRIRHRFIGEGNYRQIETTIQNLLVENIN